jgi:hypothetical protein
MVLMVPPASADMIREFQPFSVQFGYYYARKAAGGEGWGGPEVSDRMAGKSVERAFQFRPAQADG